MKRSVDGRGDWRNARNPSRRPLRGARSSRVSDSAGRKEVSEHEPVALDDLASDDRNTVGQHRSRGHEGVELAALAARIDTHGEIGEQLLVEVAARKRPIEA